MNPFPPPTFSEAITFFPAPVTLDCPPLPVFPRELITSWAASPLLPMPHLSLSGHIATFILLSLVWETA